LLDTVDGFPLGIPFRSGYEIKKKERKKIFKFFSQDLLQITISKFFLANSAAAA
jgi:hypothetical protein